MEILLKIKIFIIEVYSRFVWFPWYVQWYLNGLFDSFKASEYFFIYVPLFILWLWFFETVWIFGFFIPMEIISISVFAYLHSYLEIFLISVFVFLISILLGLFVGYYIGRKYYWRLINYFENKYPILKDYLIQIDEYLEKYHILAFPIIINIWWTRPIMALHLGWRKYDFKKFVFWAILASLSYVLPRAIIWYYVWVFWNVILKYFKIWTKYVFYWMIWLIIIALIMDIFVWEKELEEKKE